MTSPISEMSPHEIERWVRKHRSFVPVVTLLLAWIHCLLLYGCLLAFERGHPWLVVISGLLLHSFMIVTVHESSHEAVFQNTFLDGVFLNLCAGIVLLPVYGEGVRKYHLMHHAYTNHLEKDPIFTPLKKELLERSRLLFIAAEFVPLGTTLASIVTGGQRRRQLGAKSTKIRPAFVIFSLAVALAVFYLIRPSWGFWLGTLFFGGIWSTVRNWCEHFGVDSSKASNVYTFPLGWGEGNHELHHRHPTYSWITCALDLARRPKDTSFLRTLYWALFDPRFRHYETVSN